MKAMEIIEKYQLCHSCAIRVITNFLCDDVLTEELCKLIDNNGQVDDFAYFMEAICGNSNHDQVEQFDDAVFLRRLEDMESEPIARGRVKHSADGDHERFAFLKWKAKVILKILEHPAMQTDSEPALIPDFDSLSWQEDFLSGMTVDEAFEKADTAFNNMGW